VTTLAAETTFQVLARRLRSPATWQEAADLFAILTVASLPWSTSLAGIFNVLWSEAAWGARFYAVGPTVKLLVLPVLLYHFERSRRGYWIFIAFLVSCALLSVMSWLVAFYPGLSLKPAADAERGIFVKNYIDQSQEFALCAVALGYPVVLLLREKRYWLAGLLTALALSFFVNMTFVVVSRTALVTVPIMLGVFALLHLKWRSIAVIAAALLVGAALAWQASPQLRKTADTFSRDYRLYMQENVPTSMGERLEYWRKSLQFFAQAPLAGHGTGSSQGLFAKAAKEADWVPGVRVFPNPHNQTLAVAVQWGAIGIVALYAMWLVHLLLFRGDGLANWIGLLVVVQNVFTSLFNSHLFDFHEGWMYVIGVGVAGGMVIRAQRAGQKTVEAGS
jgi:O-antigen ligase